MTREYFNNVTHMSTNEISTSTVYVKLRSNIDGTETNRGFTQQAFRCLVQLLPDEGVVNVEFIYNDDVDFIVRDAVVQILS